MGQRGVGGMLPPVIGKGRYGVSGVLDEGIKVGGVHPHCNRMRKDIPQRLPGPSNVGVPLGEEYGWPIEGGSADGQSWPSG
jgi:hypothetical protein